MEDWWRPSCDELRLRAGDKHRLSTTDQQGVFQGSVRQALIAIDLGADSCRVSLLSWVGGESHIRLVHRFPNSPAEDGSHLRWDLARIDHGIREGLRKCAELAPEGIAAIGVDGWAVDYVRLGPDGRPLSNPFCYRDKRTVQAQKDVLARISCADLYKLTGIQCLLLNTLYQLHADPSQNVPAAAKWVNLPEFVLCSLGGERVSEYTNATHTQMLGVSTRTWSKEIFTAAGVDFSAAPPVVPPGTVVGHLQGELASLPSFSRTKLIAPACHDTASAIAGISADSDDWAFISSGTWSLVGCVLDSPCLSARAREGGFSNQGGIAGKFNFLRNVNGMWLIQQCLQQWAREGHTWTLEELIDRCSNLPRPEFVIDVDDPDMLLPGDMPARVNSQLRAAGRSVITEAPPIANLIFHSLAARCAGVLQDLASITGKRFRHLQIVGGANKNAFLNRLTGNATGLEVKLGPSESSTVGNFAIQLAALTGQYDEHTGVRAAAVAEGAQRLGNANVSPQAGQALEFHNA
jgi:rhamnulokinase